jgi:hypothetical protein
MVESLKFNVPGSPSLEIRRAFLGERSDPFGVVLRAAEGALRIALDIELLGERMLPR